MSDLDRIRDYWKTEIVDVADGNILYRGYPIEQLIGNVRFPDVIWLLLRGELPGRDQSELLEAAMVASVNAGPMSPSCTIASMAITCGVGLNNAVASGINALGDTHGGAGEQVMQIFEEILAKAGDDGVEAGVERFLDTFFAGGGKFLPGFGHRFHSSDPRAQRLLALVGEAESKGAVSGRYRRAALALEAALSARKGKTIPINVDGAFAVVIAELGFAPPLGRGIFLLARSVGLLAHACETQAQGQRIKGPVPNDVMYTYAGPARRDLKDGGRND